MNHPSQPPHHKLTIALVMIVRNEEACIARCLTSAMAHVDEVIVLDTGSTDDTVRIASDLGARVHQMAWIDDFAAARNAALAHANADWNLVLDADEWLVEGGATLRQEAEAATASGQPFLGLLPIHSEVQAPATGATPAGQTAESVLSWIPRLLPLGVRYVGRIHEQPASDLPRRKLSVQIAHDGYNRDKMIRKAGRNRRLLIEAVAAEPENPYLLYQLGKDYDIYAEPALALDCYEKALHRVKPNQGYRVDLVVRTIVCLTRTGALELGYQFAEDEMAFCRQSPDFFYVLAELLHGLAHQQPEKSLSQWLPLVRVSLLFCLKLGDTPDIAGSVRGRGSHLASQALSQLDKILLPSA
jgi:hypothetical protein